MPGDPFRRVTSGDKLEIAADAWNAVVEAAMAHRRNRGRAANKPAPELKSTGIIRVVNNTGAPRSRLDVVGLQSPAIDPGDNENEFLRYVIFNAVAPSEDYQGKFAILLEPLGNGKVGHAYVSGVCPAYIYYSDESEADYKFADVNPGDPSGLKPVEKGGSGQILWKAGTSSRVLALVRLSNPHDAAETPGQEKVRWGVCQANWTYIGKGSGGNYPSNGGRARVTVKECDDSVGTNPHGDDIVVYLPSNAGGDPNLVAGDVIAFVVTANTTPVCVSSYMDDPIGTVKMFTGTSGETRPGWVCMNGSQNTDKTRTGEAWSMVDKFPRGACSDGQIGLTGGSETHDHGGETGSSAPLTSSNTTGIAVDNHPAWTIAEALRDHDDHSHLVAANPEGPQFAPQEDGGSNLVSVTCTSGVKSAANCGEPAAGGELGHYGKESGGDLTHYVTDPGHQHDVDDHTHTIPTDSHLPPYRTLRFIERVDNSA